MKFTELTIHTTSEGSELIADILWGYTNYGVAISDVKDVIALQRDKTMYWDYIDDTLLNSSEVLVKAFVPKEDTKKVLPKIRGDIEETQKNGEGFINFGTLEITRREVEGDDWLEMWRTHFRPIHIDDKMVIVPEWINYEGKEGEVIVKLDSNMAFGTGEHETTCMCLKLLRKYLKNGDTCIDVGCGSGILGIFAVKLGAAFSYLSDIDEIAVKSATHNSSLNCVTEKTLVTCADLISDGGAVGDIILANITAEILCRLAPSIPHRLKKGGTLILSGIIDSRLEKVKEEFCRQGLELKEILHEGEWYALALKAN